MRTSLLVLSKSVLWNVNCLYSSSSNSGISCSLVVVVVCVCLISFLCPLRFPLMTVKLLNPNKAMLLQHARLLTEAKTRTVKQEGEVQKVGEGLWCKHKIQLVTNSVFA